MAQIARLPTDKLEAACRIVQQWRSRKWCNCGQLESLIGHLQHAAKVVWPDRTFLRWMIDLLCCFRNRDHLIRLNHEFRLDFEWWHTLSSWNGVSFWLFPGMSPPADVEVVSDASGSLGFGAHLNGAWFSGSCADPQQSQSITYKELFPVVLAARVRGAQWPRQHILFRCDNEAVVHILNSRTSKVPALMHLLRDLLLSEARFSFSAKHVPGVHNEIADALSRFRW